MGTERRKREHKDFYAGNDSDFVAHKSKLSDQHGSIKKIQTANKYSDINLR
jgi:hypothetical protein